VGFFFSFVLNVFIVCLSFLIGSFKAMGFSFLLCQNFSIDFGQLTSDGMELFAAPSRSLGRCFFESVGLGGASRRHLAWRAKALKFLFLISLFLI